MIVCVYTVYPTVYKDMSINMVTFCNKLKNMAVEIYYNSIKSMYAGKVVYITSNFHYILFLIFQRYNENY